MSFLMAGGGKKREGRTLTHLDFMICALCYASVQVTDPATSIEDSRTPMQKHTDWHKYLNSTFQKIEVEE